MKIKTRLQLSALVTIGIAVVIGLFLMSATVREQEAVQKIGISDDIIRAVFNLSAVTNDYFQQHETRDLSQWRRGDAALNEVLNRAVSADPSQRVIIDRLRHANEELAACLSEAEARHRESPTGARHRELDDRLASQLAINLNAMVSDATEFDEAAMAEIKTVVKEAAFTVKLLFGALILVVIVSSMLLGRGIILPLNRLHEGVEVIAAGNLEHRVGTTAKDEVGQLARAFDTMTQNLQATMASRDLLNLEVENRKRVEAELDRSNRELEYFAYVTSHDLQEPLRMVSSYVQLLARRYQGRLDSDADEFIHYAVDGALRMQRMINDLLSYSRIGTRGEPFVPTDCEEVLGFALDNLKIAIEESEAVVSHDPLPMVNADGSQLTQLFQNLIGNAIKFRKQGEAPRVRVQAKRSGAGADLGPGATPAAGQRQKTPTAEGWLFSVSDNGIGIDPCDFDRLFKIFQRLHGREEYPGTGIGLAVCQRIVERHGGRLWVESTPDHGATFFFTLPG